MGNIFLNYFNKEGGKFKNDEKFLYIETYWKKRPTF
jgi:hypothetical protein